MIPDSPFWDFSLRLYAKAGVPDACLALQARHGIDVNLLFCCLWLGLEGERLGRHDVARLAARVRDMHEGVVKPLRAARTLLKRLVAAEDEPLRPALGALRNAIKKSELDAEHLEQAMLGTLRPVGTPDTPSSALAKGNAQIYFDFTGARLAADDESSLALIVAALPQIVPKHGRDNDKREHMPPLARRGQGRSIP
jgi:uncharacterized protein (TIGR02444 family)